MQQYNFYKKVRVRFSVAKLASVALLSSYNGGIMLDVIGRKRQKRLPLLSRLIGCFVCSAEQEQHKCGWQRKTSGCAVVASCARGLARGFVVTRSNLLFASGFVFDIFFSFRRARQCHG